MERKKTSSKALFSIRIENLKIKAIIGILPQERLSEQNLIIDVQLDYLYDGHYLDYLQVQKQIVSMLEKGQYGLLEDAINDIISQITRYFPQITAISVSLKKPDILDTGEISVRRAVDVK